MAGFFLKIFLAKSSLRVDNIRSLHSSDLKR